MTALLPPLHALELGYWHVQSLLLQLPRRLLQPPRLTILKLMQQRAQPPPRFVSRRLSLQTPNA
jgi:hypothetical protein